MPDPDWPDPDRPDLAALLGAALGRPTREHEPLAIAVSGGPDSVALLLLAAAAFPGRVTALTVDHALRPEAAAEAATLAAACAAAQIPHHTLVWTGTKPTANLQAAARAARYALLAAWCAANDVRLLLTAHHADDQAETLLLRLARGSGNTGLAGIRPVRDLGQGVTLVRPLLATRRADLHAVASTSGWPIAADPSNHDPRHDRTHARQLLARTPWLDPARLAAAAAHAADVEASLAWTTDLAWASRTVVTEAAITLDAGGLPAELQRRLVARALARFGSRSPAGPDLTRLLTRLTAGATATLAGVKAEAERGGGAVWRFTRAPARTRAR